MRAFKFNLEPTATYRQRACVWYAGPGFSGDGLLTVTLVHARSYKVEQDAYGVEEIGPERFGTRRFELVGVLTEHDAPEVPYVVTTGAERRCTCECGKKGYKRATCKHISAIEFLIQCGRLPAREVVGA